MPRALSSYTVIVSQPTQATFGFMALNDDNATRTAAAVVKLLGPGQSPVGTTRSVE